MEFKRHAGRISHAFYFEDACWQDQYDITVISDNGSGPPPHVYAVVKSGGLSSTLPRLKPEDARSLAALLIAAADDAESPHSLGETP